MKFNTEIEYCLIEFKMSNQTYYCLWFSDNRDAFIEKTCLNDIDCNLILRFWNIASDMAYTLKESFIGNDDGVDCVILDVYNKLFYGTNPPALKKDSPEVYIPTWTKEERLILGHL